MGREIRRVPENWQHPTYDNPYHGEVLKPLLGRSFADEAKEWDVAKKAWDSGERPDYFNAARDGSYSFEEWHGERPEPEWYVPYDLDAPLPWWQMYETVSEGTPVTPAFATPEELVEHLATIGEDYGNGTGSGPWDRGRAKEFVCNERSAPTFVIDHGHIYDAKSGFPKP